MAHNVCDNNASRRQLNSWRVKSNPLGLIIFSLVLVSSIRIATAEEELDNDDVIVRVPAETYEYYQIPKRDEIKYIEAEMYYVNTPLGRLPDVPRFILPVSQYDAVLEFFLHPKIDTAPRPIWPEIGSLKIVSKNGRVLRLSYYSRMGTGKLSYSVEGIRCYDGRVGRVFDDALSLDHRLRMAYQEVTGHITTERIEVPK